MRELRQQVKIIILIRRRSSHNITEFHFQLMHPAPIFSSLPPPPPSHPHPIPPPSLQYNKPRDIKGLAHAATFAYCNRNTGPATIAGLPAANPQGLQAVCRAKGRISIPARKLQCCSQSQRGISYDTMTHSLDLRFCSTMAEVKLSDCQTALV